MNSRLWGKILLGVFICLLFIDGFVIAFFFYTQKVNEANQSKANILVNQMIDSVSTSEANQKTPAGTSSTWATQKSFIIQTATAENIPPVAWTIEIMQNGAPVAEQNGAYNLQVAPFTIRVHLPKYVFDQLPVRILLNVLDRADNYQKVQPGSINDMFCDEKDPDCFILAGMAETASSTGRLVLDKGHGIGSHFLYYNGPKDNRWDQVNIQGQEVILDRTVSSISLHQAENNTQTVAIEDYTGKQLYLVFILDYRAGSMVTSDELKKAIILFP